MSRAVSAGRFAAACRGPPLPRATFAGIATAKRFTRATQWPPFHITGGYLSQFRSIGAQAAPSARADHTDGTAVLELRAVLSRIRLERSSSRLDYTAVLRAMEKISPHSLPAVVQELHALFRYQRASKAQLIDICTGKLRDYVGTHGGSIRAVLSLVNHLSYVRCGRDPAEDQAAGGMLIAAARALNSLPSAAVLPDKDVGSAVWGLCHRSTKDMGVKTYLTAITRRLSPSGDLSGSNGKFLGQIAHGLQGMAADCPQVKRLLAAVTARAEALPAPLPGRTISAMLYGLKSMDPGEPEVEALLRSLADQLRVSGALSPGELSVCLLGLANKSCRSAAVRELVSELAAKAGALPADAEWRDWMVANALFGLQSMSADATEVERLLGVLLACTHSILSSTVLNEHHLSKAFYGFKSMSMDSPSSRGLLRLLGRHLGPCPQELSPRGLAMVAQGLRAAAPDCAEARDVLSQLADKLAARPIPPQQLTPADLALAFSGLERFLGAAVPEARALLAQLTGMLEVCPLPFAASELCALLRAVKGMPPGDAESDRALAAIERRFNDADARRFSSDELVDALGCLHAADSRSESAARMLGRLSAALNRLNEMTPIEIARALLNMKGRSAEDSEVRRVLATLAERALSCGRPWGSRELASALHGLSGMRCDCDEVRAVLVALASKLTEYKGRGFETAQALAMALYGLQGMRCREPEVQHLLSALLPVLQRSAGLRLGPVELMSSFTGLRSMTTNDFAVIQILELLLVHLERCGAALSPRELSAVLKGLNGMSSALPVVRRLADLLTQRIQACRELFSAADLGACLYGLQSMSVHSPSVQALVSAVADKLEGSAGPFGRLFFAGGLFGLQNTDAAHPTARRLLRLLALRMEGSAEPFVPWTVGNALYGLQSMSSDVPEVRRLLAAIIDKTRAVSGSMTSQGIGNALYGLQSMDSGSAEVRELLLLLRGLMQRASAQDCVSLNPQEVGNALFGLRNMSYLAPGVPELLLALLEEAGNCVRLFEHMPTMDWERWTRVLVHSIVLTIPHIPDLPPAVAGRFEALLPALAGLLKDSEYSGSDVCPSSSEQRVLNIMRTHFKGNGSVSIAANKYLNHFEADIVISFPVGDRGRPCVVNLEVDGAPSHHLLTARRFQRLRDSYLTGLGVVVLRLQGPELRELSQANTGRTLRRLLLTARLPEGAGLDRARVVEALLGPVDTSAHSSSDVDAARASPDITL